MVSAPCCYSAFVAICFLQGKSKTPKDSCEVEAKDAQRIMKEDDNKLCSTFIRLIMKFTHLKS